MPLLNLRVITIVQSLENEAFCAEPLFFSGLATYGDNRRIVRDTVARNARKLMESDSPIEFHRRRIAALPAVSEAALVVEPPRSKAWVAPLELKFHVLTWQQGPDLHVACVPALGIEVLARNATELGALLPGHIRFALSRRKALESPRALVYLQRCVALEVAVHEASVVVKSPKERAAATGAEAAQKPVLDEIGYALGPEQVQPAYEVDHLVAQLAEALTGSPPRSVLLVGKPGAGKTAVAHELVRQRSRLQLGHVPFWSTSGARIVAGMAGYGMWQLRCQRLWHEASKERAIVLLGNLAELLDAGKCEHVSQGVAGFLRPYLERGDLLAIVECTPEQQIVIEQQDPHLLTAFDLVRIEEPSETAARRILQRAAESLSARHRVSIAADALDKTDRLHRRYATYSAFPGRPLRFLRNLFHDAVPHAQIGVRDVTAAFSRETGLPLFMLDPDVPLDLEQTRQWFAENVVGQAQAVACVVNVLAAAKAGLARPRRPLASLLLIGPTGVGKTEMAKALAERLFGDRSRLSRFDMSEFAEADAVHRLIGYSGSCAEGLLTAKVREQPFSVLLFDEFEKAHPLFFDLLLQVLGDARLTDAAGRVADFTNAVVVMTSNLGAQSFQQGRSGFTSGRPADPALIQQHFLQEVRGFLRPELFNRIDQVIAFAPLSDDSIRQIARRELGLIARRDGVRQRRLALQPGEPVVAHLAKVGMDARYGARPLKRAIERELLVPLADGLNAYSAELAVAADISVHAGKLAVRVHAQTGTAGQPARASALDSGEAALAVACTGLRRRLQRIERSSAVQELRNEIVRLSRLAARATRRSKPHQAAPPDRRLETLKGVAAHLEALAARLYQLEEQFLLAALGQSVGSPSSRGVLDAAAGDCQQLLLELYALEFPNPDRITLALFSDHLATLLDLTHTYLALAEKFSFRAAVFLIGLHGAEVVRAFVARPDELLTGSEPAASKIRGLLAASTPANIEKRFLGVALQISGAFANPLLAGEEGSHFFSSTSGTRRVRVHTSDAKAEEYSPPAAVIERDEPPAAGARRTYALHNRFFEDAHLGRKFEWTGQGFMDSLLAAVDQWLQLQMEKLLET